MQYKRIIENRFGKIVLLLIPVLRLFSADSTFWDLTLRVPETTPPKVDIYIAGTFNNWDPGTSACRFQQCGDGLYRLKIRVPAGPAAFKFTMGDWASVESRANGEMLRNRKIRFRKAFQKDRYRIRAWAEPAAEESIEASLCGRIDIIENFYMPQLKRNRRIWVYLPPNYENTEDAYPVLYMQDGQNCFSQAASFSGEWQADETLERMIRTNRIPPLMVVAVDNSPEYRLNEYAPFSFSYRGKNIQPEAELYAAFLAETLKPHIDRKYRTKPEREHTAIAGSSMGAVVSLYTALHYDRVFSMAAALSSSFRLFPDEIKSLIKENPSEFPMKYWIDIGSREAERPKDHFAVAKLLKNTGENTVRCRVILGAEHSEESWKRRFSRILRYFYGGLHVL